MTGATEVQNETTVHQDIVVNASPELAFHVFTQRLGDWWPGHHIGSEEPVAFILDGGDGGRWYERSASGGECDWGRVLAWDPPRRLVLEWAINAAWQADPGHASEVEVTFTEERPGRTRVSLTHRNIDRAGDGWEQMRQAVGGDGGWPGILARYAAVVAS